MKSTSIIIPTFNELVYLKACIESIRTYTDSPYEIIVIDNGSNDGTIDFCINEKINFVSLPSNTGFPAACNFGLKIASGNTLMLLNNDVLVWKDWLTNLHQCLFSSPDIGIVGPLTNYASGSQQIPDRFTNLKELAERFHLKNRGQKREVHRLVGLCMLFKREVMERIGFLDEEFSPGHYEDDDYSYRARLAGYRLMIAEDTFIFHHGSVTFQKEGEEAVKQLLEKNAQKFQKKWNVHPHLLHL